MEGYLGHINKLFQWHSMEWVLEIIDAFIGGDAKEETEEYDCADTTRGVFKVYAVSLSKAPSDLCLMPKYIIIRSRHEIVDSTKALTDKGGEQNLLYPGFKIDKNLI